MTIEASTVQISARASAAAATRRMPTSLPTITWMRCGLRMSSDRKVPPENSLAIVAMNVTKTKNPVNEAPTANASVAPP